MSEASRHGIGGNLPPAPLTPLEVAGYLADSARPLLTRRDELLGGVQRFKTAHGSINDDETQGLAGDFVKQIAAAIKQAKDAFTTAKRPFLDGGRAVDQFFKAITDPLEAGMNEVRRPMTVYALQKEDAERRRREAEAAARREEAARMQRELVEAQRRAQEAEAARQPPPLDPPPTIEEAIVAAEVAQQAERDANARAADLTRQRGDFGSVSSLREVWEVEVEDLSKVPLEYLLFDYAKARRDIRGGRLREIAGCRVFPSKHIQTR